MDVTTLMSVVGSSEKDVASITSSEWHQRIALAFTFKPRIVVALVAMMRVTTAEVRSWAA